MVAFALLIILVSHRGFSYPVGPICNTSAEVFLRPETSHGPSDGPKVEKWWLSDKSTDLPLSICHDGGYNYAVASYMQVS